MDNRLASAGSSGLIAPDYSKEIRIHKSSFPYKVPKDGWIRVHGIASNGGGFTLWVNDHIVYDGSASGGGTNYGSVFPVAKNDIVKLVDMVAFYDLGYNATATCPERKNGAYYIPND